MTSSSTSKGRIRQEKWYDCTLTYILLGLVAVVPITLSLLFFAESFEIHGEHEGTLSGLYQTQTEYGEATRFLVTLDNGKTVDVSATRMGPFKKGKRVLIREWRSKWFRRTRYSFIRYLEEPGSIQLLE